MPNMTDNGCLRVGQKAPDFTATAVVDQEFKEISLSQYKGGKVVPRLSASKLLFGPSQQSLSILGNVDAAPPCRHHLRGIMFGLV
jgi:hypothetical protein